METLQRYNLCELKQLAIYLEEFQECRFIEPVNVSKKKCWVESVNTMVTEKDPAVPSRYIFRLRRIIRWFLDHGFKFIRNRGNSFFKRMTRVFLYTITDTTIYLKDSDRLSFKINRLYMDLTKHSEYIQINPTNCTIAAISAMGDDWGDIFLRSRIFRRDEYIQAPPNRSNRRRSLRRVPINNYDESAFILTDSNLLSKSLNTNITDEEATDKTRALECKICLINKICVVLTKCGHTFCYTCTRQFNNKCATCRTPFTDKNAVQMFI